MIILAVDYGSKNIGLAVSDETATVAGSLPILANYGGDKAVSAVAAAALKAHAQRILLGIPMQNPQSPMYHTIQNFAGKLHRATGLTVKLWDESFSSQHVEANLRGKSRKSSDSLVAQMLLEEYLTYLQEQAL